MDLKTVNLGLASDFFHVLNYITYGDKSMKHLCSFRTLTPLSASVFIMHLRRYMHYYKNDVKLNWDNNFFV